MSRIRRALAVTGLALAAVVGVAVPASATFADSTAARTTIQTITVTAPSSMTITDQCRGRRYTATVSWPASTTARGVTGYRVMAHLNTGRSVVLGETDASTHSVSTSVGKVNLYYEPRVSIITLTSYGWTAETPRSAVLSC